MVRECPTNQRLIIGGDLNGHIGAAADGYAEVHEGFRFGDRNEEGCTVLEFATAHDLVVANSFFKKKADLKACKDCRAFSGEACSSKHRLIVVDVLLERLRHRREATRRPRILWKNLNGEVLETFRATVFERLVVKDMSASNAGQMWNTLACVMKDAAKDSLARAIKRTLTGLEKGIKQRYKAAKREAKIAVAKAKDKAYEDLYKKLDSTEGNKMGRVFLISFQRDSLSGEVGRSGSPAHFDCYYSRINHGGVRAALQKMGRNKAVGPDQIPIEAWRLNEVIPVYENKGDAQACSNYRENQFDFMPGRSTTEEIHLLISLMEKYRERQRDLHMAFLDLEKAYDSVPHDIVLTAESTKRLNNKLESWRKTLEDNGLRKRILQPKESFRYVGSVLHRSGRIVDVAHRIRAGWMKWRAASGVLCDQRIPLKLKGKFYRAAIRPAMLYGSECWPITKVLAFRVEVAELRMLRWTCCKTMVDMISNKVFTAGCRFYNRQDEGRKVEMVWACQEETLICPG
uniref:Uncharacterized protein n=1 Tax=Tanacetum cinerariifolium TaxID=118510 RepID=A0A699HEK1_TANCI|nr:hypothetical protein [Tanacetum cinerariifolium]